MKHHLWTLAVALLALALAGCADLGQENAPDNGVAPTGSHSPGFGGPDPYGPGGPPSYHQQ